MVIIATKRSTFRGGVVSYVTTVGLLNSLLQYNTMFAESFATTQPLRVATSDQLLLPAAFLVLDVVVVVDTRTYAKARAKLNALTLTTHFELRSLLRGDRPFVSGELLGKDGPPVVQTEPLCGR